jgi:uncharacterized protein (DUF305 family)
MRQFLRCRPALLGALLLLGISASSFSAAHEAHSDSNPPPASNSDEEAFLRQNQAAMSKMMRDMETRPTGDIDRDFVAMMVPHHQGLIDMALIELRYGKNEQLRRMAQEIVVDQMQEIVAMNLAIGVSITPCKRGAT